MYAKLNNVLNKLSARFAVKALVIIITFISVQYLHGPNYGHYLRWKRINCVHICSRFLVFIGHTQKA